jgi:hypothetical protein
MNGKIAYFVWIYYSGRIIGKFYHGEEEQLKNHIEVIESNEKDFDFKLNNKYYKKV